VQSLQDAKLLEYFARGLIPGPEESEEEFIARANGATPLGDLVWSEASLTTKTLFGFAVDWVPLEFSSQKLSWWEGGATFIDGAALPSIVLRPSFAKGSFLGTSSTEVLAHEAVHAARMRFCEPKFEEMLAYATSPKRWKRCLGPFFSYRWSLPCLLASSLLGFLDLWLSFGVFAALFLPLIRRHVQWRRCRKKFSLPALLCMTDEEIIRGEMIGKGELRLRLLRSVLQAR
jgi:hypothetical protein